MKKVTPLVLLGLAAVLMYFAVYGSHGYFQLRRTHREGLALERKSASLDKEIRELRRQIRAIEGDPLALERQAREGLGFGKENETLYIFPSRHAEGDWNSEDRLTGERGNINLKNVDKSAGRMTSGRDENPRRSKRERGNTR